MNSMLQRVLRAGTEWTGSARLRYAELVPSMRAMYVTAMRASNGEMPSRKNVDGFLVWYGLLVGSVSGFIVRNQFADTPLEDNLERKFKKIRHRLDNILLSDRQTARETERSLANLERFTDRNTKTITNAIKAAEAALVSARDEKQPTREELVRRVSVGLMLSPEWKALSTYDKEKRLETMGLLIDFRMVNGWCAQDS
jgi:hypothetical protein